MRKFLIKAKTTFIYKFLIINFFSLFFEIFWQYIINFKSKLLYFYYGIKTFRKSYYNFSKKSFLLVQDDEDFKKIAHEINTELSSSMIAKAKDDLAVKFNPETDTHDYSKILNEYISENLKKKIINFSISSKNIKTASNYLKVLPYIAKITLYMNIPLKRKTPKFAQLWHRDDFGYKSLDLFLAIRKIDNLNGPLHYVNNSSINNIFLQVPDEIKAKIRGERNKHSIEHFDKFVNEKDTSSFLGNAGDGLWIDSFRTYHRGGQCFENERFMLRISYQTPDNVRSVKFNDEHFIYDKSIKKKEINKIFQKHYFFGYKSFLVSKLNLTKKLLYLYRMVSIKINKI
jgi:hypothetical protein